jgi:hypothetical protein
VKIVVGYILLLCLFAVIAKPIRDSQLTTYEVNR